MLAFLHSLSAIVSEAWTKLAESSGAANSGSGQGLHFSAAGEKRNRFALFPGLKASKG
jgi:hypothetical protein